MQKNAALSSVTQHAMPVGIYIIHFSLNPVGFIEKCGTTRKMFYLLTLLSAGYNVKQKKISLAMLQDRQSEF